MYLCMCFLCFRHAPSFAPPRLPICLRFINSFSTVLHFLLLIFFLFLVSRILIRFHCFSFISVPCLCFSLFLVVPFSPCFFFFFFLNLYFVRPNLHLHTTKLSRVSKIRINRLLFRCGTPYVTEYNCE